MGNPTFWYYPDPDGSIETVDLADTLSDLVETPVTETSDARGLDWVASRTVLGSGLRVRIELERFGASASSSLERALRTLENHLHRGGLVGFAADSAKAWAAVAGLGQVSGTTSWVGSAQIFTVFAPAAALASGDEVVIETPSPEAQREYNTAGATVTASTNLVTLASALRYTFGPNSVLRWRDFFPIMRLPSDQTGKTLVTNDRRRNFTLSVDLEYTPADVIAYAGGPVAQLAQTTSVERATGLILGVPGKLGGY